MSAERTLIIFLSLALVVVGYLMLNVSRADCVWSADLDGNVACVSADVADLHNCYADNMLGPDDVAGQRYCEVSR